MTYLPPFFQGFQSNFCFHIRRDINKLLCVTVHLTAQIQCICKCKTS